MFSFGIALDRPGYLWLLVFVPALAVYGWRQMAALAGPRRSLAILIRCIVWSLLVFAVAGVQWIRTDDRMTVMYLLDQSESIPAEKRAAMLRYVIENVRQHRDVDRRDQAGIVVFGRDATIEIPPYEGNIPALRRLESLDSATDATNLQAALNLAGAAMSEDTARRIVIVTDGNENLGEAQKQAARLAASGVGIDVVPVRLGGGKEVLVEKIDLPNDIRTGQPFEARVVVNRFGNGDPDDDERPLRGRLRVKQDVGGEESLLLEQTVTLQPGKNVFPLRHQIDQPAAYVYNAEFIADSEQDDTLRQNNTATAYTHVRGKGRVLVIVDRGDPDGFSPMISALRNSDIEVIVQTSDRLFSSLAELQSYDAVILAGVPRVVDAGGDTLTSMSDQQIEMLVRNTQQLGAGLLMIGGKESFGAGGWTGTKIEEAMPVDFKIKNDKVQAVGALALIMHASEMAQGNYWQKVIAKAAIEQLGPSDYAGVLHWTMNGDAWLWGGQTGLQTVGANRRSMLAAIGRMTPGDMPQFDPAMKMAAAGLSRLGGRVSVRHCVIVSDGDPTAPSPATVSAFQSAGITISTVAVASHGLTESRRLQEIASATGGKYYKAASGKALPSIFQREARRVSKPLVRDIPDGAQPQIVFPHPMLEGISRTLPPITGLVLTQTKDSSLPQVLIRSPQPDAPENSTVLAVWNYGLGRTAALTTDVGQRWATSWTEWEDYEKFYSQLVRWLMRPTGDTGKFSIATTTRDGEVQVVVNAISDDDDFLNFLDINASVIGPDLQPIPLRMNQTAPGRYVGTFDGDRSGNYFVNVNPGVDGPPLSTGVTVPYSEEYRVRQSDESLMQRLVSIQPRGGQAGQLTPAIQSSDNADLIATDAFRGGLAPARSIRDSWHWFVLLACVCFLADVFVRRVSIRLDFLKRWIDRLRGVDVQPSMANARLDNLRAAKARAAGEGRRTSVRFEPTAGNRSGNQSDDRSVDLDPASNVDQSAKNDSAAKQSSSNEKTSGEAKSYTERLLEAKRRARKD